jgi:hypothetical protein
MVVTCLAPCLCHSQAIHVAPNVQVSKANGARAHYEVHLSADPEDPQRLLGGAMEWHAESNEYQVVAYASFDGGRHWQPTLQIKENMMDPAVAHGPDGRAYFACWGQASDDSIRAYLYRSGDAGKSWLAPVEMTVMDREFITVDSSDSKFHGRVYVHGTNGARVIDEQRELSGLSVLWSDDGGDHLRGPFTLSSSGSRYVLGMGNGVILSDGSFVALFGERLDAAAIEAGEAIPTKANARLAVVRSEDGGSRFSPANVVADWYMQFGSSTGNIPSLAADGSKGVFQDRLYATWSDVRSGRSEILLASSTDKGRTWSSPVVVNDDEAPMARGQGPNHLMPVVAVNQAGVVGVMWYDRRDQPDNLSWRVRFSASFDGGETFVPSAAVSEAPFKFDLARGLVTLGITGGGGEPHRQGGPLRATIALHHFNNKGGDTAGLAADAAGVFHPFWIDNRTGTPQVWTARVSVSGQAIRNGAVELQDLQDLSAKLAMQIASPRFDHETGQVSADITLRNTSTQALRLPIVGRLLAASSKFGPLRLTTSNNGLHGPGATLVFEGSGSLLKATESTRAKRVIFQLRNSRVLEGVRNPALGPADYSLVQIQMKALGTAE